MPRRFRARAALALLGLVVPLLLAEIGLRVAPPIQSRDLLPLTYNRDAIRQLAAGTSYLRFDPVLGWVNAPAVALPDAGGAIYQTNGAAIRAEREYSIEPPPGVRRLAAFGDSFTHCDEVSNADCWTAVLERAWEGSEVLNFGVPGYGPDQAWLRYRREGRPYQPCGVLVGYMIENVNRVVNRFRPFYAPESGIALSKPRFILQGNDLRLLPNPAVTPELLDDARWVEANLGPNDAWYFPGMFVANPLDVSQVVRVARSAAYRRTREAEDNKSEDYNPLSRKYREDQEGFQVAGRVLIEFAREVRQDGATPVVVVFSGRRDVVTARRGGDKVYQLLLDWLAREGIPTFDAVDRLAREANRSGVDTLIARGGHYNKAGNQVAGSALARQLQELTAPTCGEGRRP